MPYALNYKGTIGRSGGGVYRPVTWRGWRDAIYNAHRAYYFGKKVNTAIRSAKSSAVPRSHPRDFKTPSPKPVSKSISKVTPRSYTRANTNTNRGYGAYSSKSGGFLRTRRKSRKPKGWQAGKGVTSNFETGSVIGDQDCLYIGHGTGPRERLFEVAFQCILKLLCIKMNVRIKDFYDRMDAVGFNVGDSISIYYSSTPISTITSTFTYVLLAAPTFQNVVNAFKTWAESTINSSDIMPLRFEYSPGTANLQFASVDISELMLHYDIKSSLKIQNRSINSAGNDEADEVDNVPLYGKSIGGSGTGVAAKFPSSTTPANIVIARTTGLISKVALDDNAKEPLSGYFWPKSSQEGKVHLDPGVIKTSVLSTKRNISLKYMFRLFASAIGSTSPITSFGRYRFFELEKMIDTGTVINLLVAYELNTSISCFATTKYNWSTAPLYNKY